MNETILATGAEGRFASLVLPAVAAHGATVRGPIRDPAAADRVRQSGAAETAVGDLTDRSSIDRALQGVASVFYIAPCTFELCTGDALNRLEVAELISQVAGQKIRAEKVDPATLGADAAPMRPMFAHYDRRGLRGNSLTTILKRKPRTLRAYFEELAATTTKDS